MNNVHLSDEEIVNYVNSRNSMAEDLILKVERHIYLTNCKECKAKVNELEKLNTNIRVQFAENSVDEELFGCAWQDKIVDFVHKRLNSTQKSEFIEHMTDCDECRRTIALMRLTVLPEPNVEITTDNQTNVWSSIKDGVVRLSKAINLSNEGFEINLFTPSLVSAGTKFRGPGDSQSNNKKSIEIKLPENSGNIKVTYYEQTGRFDKIVIEPLGVIRGELLVEIYNSSNILLKSVDSSKPVSCLVEKDEYTIKVNSRFEIPINLG